MSFRRCKRKTSCPVIIIAHFSTIAAIWPGARPGREDAFGKRASRPFTVGTRGRLSIAPGGCKSLDLARVENFPAKHGYDSKEIFKEAALAAVRTKVVCAGGSSVDVKTFLQRLRDQIFVSGASVNATGRNIHQKPLKLAVRMCNAIYAITVDSKSIEEALEIYQS